MEKRSLETLHCRQKWNTIRRKCKVGNIFLFEEAATDQNNWPVAEIVATAADKSLFVRSVKLMLGTSGTTDMALQYLQQLVNELVMLVENE